MTLEEALKLLKETDSTAFDVVNKELETRENKGKGVEAERKKAEDTKKELDDAKAAHITEVETLNKKVEAAEIAGKTDTDGFKKLYDSEKEKNRVLEENNSGNVTKITELEKDKTDFEALVAADIEKLYEGLEEDDLKTLKSLAEKYPIQERVAFIVDFKGKYLWGTKQKGGKPNGGSGADVTTMEDIQAEYDKLTAMPYKSAGQRKALIIAGEYLSWKRKLPT